MFGTLNPKIPATRASNTSLKWSPRGLALNSTIVTSMNSGDSRIYFNTSTGSVYAYLNTTQMANSFVPYTGAVGDVNLGLYKLISSTAAIVGGDSQYPASPQFYVPYTPIVPYSVSGYAGGYSTYYYDNNGDGILYDSSLNVIGTIDYNSGYVDTSAYGYATIDSINYSYYPPSYTTQVSYDGSNFDNGITASKDNASYAASFSDSSRYALFCENHFAGQFFNSVTSHYVTLCDANFAVNAAGISVVGYVSYDRVRFLLQNTNSGNHSSVILWNSGSVGYTGSEKWEMGNDYGRNTTDDFFLFNYATANVILYVDQSRNFLIGSWSSSPTDYTQFDPTGHQTMVGLAKPWEDLRIEPVARTSGTNAPVFEKWYDDAAGTSRGVYLYSFDNAITNNQKEVFFTMQMPHEWDAGEIHFHVHWVPKTDETGKEVIWGLEYTWKDIGEVYGDTTIVYSSDVLVPDDADIVAGKHYISSFTALVPDSTNDGLSSILIGRLFRFSGDASDTYTDKVGLLYIDAHYQKNSLGSNDEYSK